ncbi:MAG: serine/threonine protein kinase, partial [Anaerolineae bacterium]|nr:serine/threonine protein kinase [Anaerolineae bacterium]
DSTTAWLRAPIAGGASAWVNRAQVRCDAFNPEDLRLVSLPVTTPVPTVTTPEPTLTPITPTIAPTKTPPPAPTNTPVPANTISAPPPSSTRTP